MWRCPVPAIDPAIERSLSGRGIAAVVADRFRLTVLGIDQ
jgi:hypothetical protein